PCHSPFPPCFLICTPLTSCSPLHDALPIFLRRHHVVVADDVTSTMSILSAEPRFAPTLYPAASSIDSRLRGIGLARSAAPLIRSDRKSTRLNSSHGSISYAVFCLKKKKNKI